MSMPRTSRRPSLLTPTAMITATDTIRSVPARFHIGGVQPDVGPLAFERTIEERLDPRVDLLAQPADLALGHAAHRPSPGRGRPPNGSRRPGCRPPGLRRSAPSPPCAAARESSESTSLSAAWGCAARSSRRASPSPGRDSRCAGPADRGSSVRTPRQ